MASDGGIELGILGPLAAKRGGQTLPLGGVKQRTVLAVLVVAGGRSVSTDALIESLWPERAPGRPQTAIQGYVSHLRKALGADAIVTEANGYRLAADVVALDAVDFERRLSRAPELAPVARAGELEAALALWRGPALAEFAYDSWAQQEISRLEELRLIAREARLDAELALGHGSELVPELEALVREQPLRERIRGQLMLALYRAGRQADALEAFAATRSTLRDELGLEPGPELQALQRAILNQELEQARPAVAPAPRATPPGLLGRDRDVERVVELLSSPETRLVTLTGPGGIGKTSLARAASDALAAAFPDGVVLVELAPVRDPDHVPAAVAAELHEDDAVEAICERRLLLLLDNLEQLLPGVAAWIAQLLERCPSLAVLATSRERLHLHDEVELPVEPLEAGPATALFVERAGALGVGVADDDPGVAELCRRLDHLPLALELAAARAKLFSPAELLDRLELGQGPVDAPERHRTLTATIDWSVALLGDAERDLFESLAVFAGPFDVDDVEAVLEADVATLASLVDKSLVARRPEADQGRLSLLATVRDAVRPRLSSRPDAIGLARRHAEWVARELQAHDDRLTGPDEADALREIGRRQDDLRAALEHAEACGDGELALRLVAGAGWFWYVRGRLAEGSRWAERALALSRDRTPLRAIVCMRAGSIADALVDVPLAERRYREALEIRRELGDREGEYGPSNNLGNLALQAGDYGAALTAHEACLAMARELGETGAIASSLHNLALVHLAEDHPAAALPLLEESLVHAESLGSAYGLGNVHANLGAALVGLGKLEAGESHLGESVRILLELDALDTLCPTIEDLAALALARGDAEEAPLLLGAAAALRSSIGAGRGRSDADRADRTAARARERVGAEAYDRGLAAGVELTRAEVLELAKRAATAAANA